MNTIYSVFVFSIIFSLCTVINSTPTYQSREASVQGEVRISPSNRDACLAKLICGMTASGTIQDELQNFGQFAHVIDKFFIENPAGEKPSAESLEMLEDYSLSSESVSKRKPSKKRPLSYKTKPSLGFGEDENKNASMLDVDSDVPIDTREQESIMSQTRESSKLFQLDDFDFRRRANAKLIQDIQAKLKVIRQCQELQGCPFSFKQLIQKYSSNNPSQPNNRVQLRRPTMEMEEPQFKPTRVELYAPQHKYRPTPQTWHPENEKFTLDEDYIDDPDDFPQRPNSRPQQASGVFHSQALAAYLSQQVQQAAPYRLKNRNRPPPIVPQWVSIKPKRKNNNGPRPLPFLSTTTPEPPPPPTQITAEPSASGTPKPKRKPTKYKIPSKTRNPEDDEDEDINITGGIQLVGNPQFDETSGSNESQRDDYDDEEKFETSVEYGNDEQDEEKEEEDEEEEEEADDEEEDEDDDEAERKLPKDKKTKKKKSSKSKSSKKSNSKSDEKKEDDEKPAVVVEKAAFPPKKIVEKLTIKPEKPKAKVENDETSSPEEDDDDVQTRPSYKDSSFLTQIGGRPMYPSGDIPISMTFGSTRPKATPSPYSYNLRPPAQSTTYSNLKPAARPSGSYVSSSSSYASPQQQSYSSQSGQQQPKPQQPATSSSTFTTGLSRFTSPFRDLLKTPIVSSSPSFNNLLKLGGGQQQSQQQNPQPQQLTQSAIVPARYPSAGPESNNFKRKPEEAKKLIPTTPAPIVKPKGKIMDRPVPKIPVYSQESPASSSFKREKKYNLKNKNKKVVRVT